ncbi:MAG: STAS-like domain-containing protein [Candidatus Edwardsbacteria bacterium]|nr:STAS-like domain-containing protein [Candidatus Edwardsbacteria bacterium]MBU1576623.1 STAS-like domain-containing protein [Candidatus Edwardsbacteria bacterium]MBU2594966.1 STAS-like domain-containing protein [Candidatus Edwardsbacteria bacterium]
MSDKEEIQIIIFQEAGCDAAVSYEDGNNVFLRIEQAFTNAQSVIIDFANIKLLTSIFLNAAIGQLFGKYDEIYIQTHLKIINISEEDNITFMKVIERAKQYFNNKKNDGIDRNIDKVMNDE